MIFGDSLVVKDGINRSGVLLLILALIIMIPAVVLADDSDNVYREDFTYSQVTELEVDGSFCEVIMNTHEEDLVTASVEIRESGINLGKEYTVHHQKDGKRLKVWVEGGNGLYLGSLQGRITITVPVEIRLDIRSVSGDIYIEHIISDSFLAGSVSGRVELNNIRADMRLESTSGEISITGSDGNKDLKSVSGKIRVTNSAGNVNLRTTSGDQYLSAVRGRITASSISGKINLQDISGELKLETTSGDITGSEVAVEGDCLFKSISGDIEIGFKNQLEGLAFDLSSVSGKLSVGGIRTEKSLTIGSEGFRINGKSTSGDQLYYD